MAEKRHRRPRVPAPHALTNLSRRSRAARTSLARSAVGPETAVVTAFTERLLRDYNYPLECIQVDPPYRISTSPSGRDYPVDIAVFKSATRATEDLIMIVETKAPTKEEGERQLKTYLQLTQAEVGAWFNGRDHFYWQKVLTRRGVDFRPLPDIPRYGQRIEDIGKFHRGDLKVPSNLKSLFREIRNHLAGQTRNITRDIELANNIIHILFCKIYDELHTPPDRDVEFRAGGGEEPAQVADRIHRLFEEQVKREFSEIFDREDQINLDNDSLTYVVGSLQNYSITDERIPRDAIGEAFEVFIGPALRGEEGQFFTPRNVVRMMLKLLKPNYREVLIDPACGSGGFLVEAVRLLWDQLDNEATKLGWTPDHLGRKKREVASNALRGIDKDRFLVKVARAYMALLGNGREVIFCEDSLRRPSEWGTDSQSKIRLEHFHVVVTNPPHGSRVRARGLAVTSQYELARKWVRDRLVDSWSPGPHRASQAVPVLFLERCKQFLRQSGRLGIVFPETYLGMPAYRYVPAWLLRQMKVRAVIAMPEDLFQPYTHNKTCIILADKEEPADSDIIIMANVRWCGHDSRGRQIPHDDVPAVTELVESMLADETRVPINKLFFTGATKASWAYALPRIALVDSILIPKYYDPRIEEEAKTLASRFNLVPLGDLIDSGIVQVQPGVEVGKLAYGTGEVPFVRTSDLSTWEIKVDPKQGISERIYRDHSRRASTRPGDILMVRDGTYLVGTVAMVTKFDPDRMLIPGGILRLRIPETVHSDIMNPYLLLALLSSPFVRRQIRAKQFTRGVIDTLGHRYRELRLPIPRDPSEIARITQEARAIVDGRAELKQRVREVLANLTTRTDAALDQEDISV